MIPLTICPRRTRPDQPAADRRISVRSRAAARREEHAFYERHARLGPRVFHRIISAFV
ncbi:hypothetical protein [Roseivivax jejudonensis]|uniref:hypothetical protein n=1 Tax=Roseivivax jejudonensis TaxID=1529041 RepID=UPI0013564233|nr:hypothetical protein [Roseivivax jejudonensis]